MISRGFGAPPIRSAAGHLRLISPTFPGRRRVHLAPALAMAFALSTLSGAPPSGGLGVSAAAAAGVCGDANYAQGIDVSKYQGEIDWPAVAASGVDFGMARIADGLTFPDATFQRNYAGMRANGITPGSYYFFEPRQDAVAQANAIVAALTTAGFGIGDLPPAIDVEVAGGQPPATVAAKVRTAVTRIQDALGVTPFIYASGVWNRIVASSEFGDVPLWVAHWLVACPNLPAGWSEWSLWQYASIGYVPGISGPVDLNQTARTSLPAYTGAPVFPGLADVFMYALGPTVMAYKARAAGPRGTPIVPSCSPATGTTFPLGTSTVACTATNEHGTSTRSFRLTVQLAAAPSFDASFPFDISAIAIGPEGAPVTWPPTSAVDYAGARLPAACAPASGTQFPVGRTDVTCSSMDSFGQTVGRSFAVSVGYRFNGLLAPVTDPITAASPVSVFAVGATMPIRFALAYADGTPIADEAADALATDCSALVWLAPVDSSDLGVDGSLTADHSIVGCARYEAAARELVADLSTSGAPPGDYTVLAAIADRAGNRLATHVAEIRLR